MRVLLVLEACSGGAGRHVIDLARGLLARGHEVSLIYSPRRAEAWFLEAISKVCRLSVFELEMHRSVTLGDISACRQLKCLIDEMGPFDVVHAHSSKAGALLRLAQVGKSVPVVYTPHAPITMNPQLSVLARSAYLIAERLLMGLCGRIICVSPAEREHFQSLGFPAHKLRVVCNGIGSLPATNHGALRRQLSLEADTICFGFVGRISHQKAVDRALSAFAMASRQVSNVRLVIVGDGPEFGVVKALAVNLGVEDQVVFTGAANGAELMNAFDVFILPSRYEGMPYVLLEAAANSLPIVMTDVGGANLVVRDGENGFVVSPMSIESMADRLVSLARQPELRDAMAIRSAEIAATFSFDRMVDETVAVYKELALT